MMRDTILNFPKQFKYRPKIEGGKVKKYKKFLICGMGGSTQPAQLLKSVSPTLDLVVHKDYDLPAGDWRKTLVIVVSYSGNTEESVSALEQAQTMGLPAVAIAVGGRLIERAKQYGIPYVQIPDTGIQPRTATGFLFVALVKVMKLNDLLRQSRELSKILEPKKIESVGRGLAEKLFGSVPIVYASSRNFPLAYMWKIKFNETGKIPAFYNVFPELNHNEMNSFDVKPSSRSLSEHFSFVFLTDTKDHPRVQKRMSITQKLYEDRGLPVHEVTLAGKTPLERIFSSLLLADWTAVALAEYYGLESEQVPMVEEFKKMI